MPSANHREQWLRLKYFLCSSSLTRQRSVKTSQAGGKTNNNWVTAEHSGGLDTSKVR